ncbi:hypothetical protein BDB00DRAFT_872524 [Zychaea mexicana]|uniref:uncharacterized protein n=1 Tax=Zychaea mexicana TaxID=64656 RepID=UPI0022FE4E96|nr:uncharacterized protein BDB00DRAFT_872524 [Zychaea mexicana]KAI9493218.1 hypothetical protein BDB00DRAFT_872524 [Zychaea mexicana]
MTGFKKKRWMLRNNNAVLPARTQADTKTTATKTPLSSPTLSDRSGVLQLHRPLTCTVSSEASSTTTPTTPSSSALKHLIPSISYLNFPTKIIPDNINSTSTTTIVTDNHSEAEEEKEESSSNHHVDPPIFDCDNHDNNDRYNHVSLEEHSTDNHGGIRPVQILTERLEAWYMLVKQLHQHFNEFANVESQISKSYGRLLQTTGVFGKGSGSSNGNNVDDSQEHQHHRQQQHPDASCSLIHTHFNNSQHGIRNVCQLWQGRHDAMAKGHATMSGFLKSNVLPSLSNMKRDLKGMIRSIRLDDRLKLSKLANLRREAKRRVLRLDRQLAFFEQHPHHGEGKQDPWLINAAVVNQMLKVYHQTNKMHETILRLQKEVMISEQRIVQEFRQLCEDIVKVREQTSLGIDPSLALIMQSIEQLKANNDWDDFVGRFRQHLIPEQARFRHPNQLQYPNHAHPLLQPVFAARMERNSSLLHRWHEYIYVLTPAGFLHEYRTTKTYPARPDTTIFVPHYNVSTLSTNLHHNLIFQLQQHHRGGARGAGGALVNMSHTPSSSTLASYYASPIAADGGQRTKSSSKTLTFRAKSAPDMQAWLEHLTELSYRYRPSVSYNAPAFLQPSNAANPEYFVPSPPPAESVTNKSFSEHHSNHQQKAANAFLPPPPALVLTSSPSPSESAAKRDKLKQEQGKEGDVAGWGESKPTATAPEDSWCQDNPWKDDPVKNESSSAAGVTVEKEQTTIGLSSFISGCIVSAPEPTPPAESASTDKASNPSSSLTSQQGDANKKEEDEKKKTEEEAPTRSFFLTGVTLPDSMQ